MERKHISIIARVVAAAAVLAPSCSPFGEDSPAMPSSDGEVRVSVDLSCDGYTPVRSSTAAGEAEVRDLQLLVVDEKGFVVSDTWSASAAAPPFTALLGHPYRVYAIANNGSRVPSLVRESDIRAWRYQTVPSQAFPNGIPMAGESGSFTPTASGARVSVPLRRLAARIDLTLSAADISEHGTFLATSLRLRGCPTSVAPFATSATPAPAVADGDRATSADLAALNAGKPVTLYLLENLRGTLLPSNTDPWAKVPDSIGATAAASCSYIEVEGDYSSVGYGGHDTYRMYPGSDATTNFDIRRNTSYRITFSPSDDNMRMAGSWKVTPSDWSDTRQVRLSSSSLGVRKGRSESLTVTLQPGAFDTAVSAAGFAEAGLSWSRSGSTITVSASEDATVGGSGTLTVSTWDGKASASCTVTVQSNGTWYYDLVVTPATATMRVGETLQLQATYNTTYWEDGECKIDISSDVTHAKEARWSSNDESVLTVDDGGLVTAISPGYKIASCIFQGGVGGCSIKVNP